MPFSEFWVLGGFLQNLKRDVGLKGGFSKFANSKYFSTSNMPSNTFSIASYLLHLILSA